jgi:hypothetical protein
MTLGVGLVSGLLVAAALAAPPHDASALDCGSGPVQVLQLDGAFRTSDSSRPATPAEADTAARQAVTDFVGSALPSLPMDEVLAAPASASGPAAPAPGAPAPPEADATLAVRAGGRTTAVVSLERDVSGRHWAVDRAVVCAATTPAPTTGPR